ncbi:MAG: DNA polymerase III subunit delta, partial [Thermodesulfobacteriota bacterium]|nr:DNA polymerase III subunit delta [Thermodesulfobacteriota bacterium]
FAHKMEKKLSNILKHNGRAVLCTHPKRQETVAWIKYEIKQHKKDIADEAFAATTKLLGNNLSEIHNEIERLAMYVGERTLIETNDVYEVISPVKEESIFNFISAVIAKDIGSCLPLLYHLKESGEPYLKILSMIARGFRQLIEVKSVLEKKGNESDKESFVTIPSFSIAKLSAQAKRYTFSDLAHVISSIGEADRLIKSSNLPDEIIIEMLIHKLCSSTRGQW